MDTCSPYLFITEKIFSELKGRKVREPIKYKGVGGKVRVQEWGKKVSVVVPGGSTRAILFGDGCVAVWGGSSAFPEGEGQGGEIY